MGKNTKIASFFSYCRECFSRHLAKTASPLPVTVFMAAILIIFAAISPLNYGGGNFSYGKKGILGGPLEANAGQPGVMETAVIGSEPVIVSAGAGNDFYPLAAGGQNVLLASVSDSGRLAGLADSRNNLLSYRVQKGDTLSGIASYFGVSLDTIINANPGVRAKYLQPGDVLNILPTSGIVYTTRDGDTLESVSSYFGVPDNKITQFNPAINFGTLGAGVSLVIPGARNFSAPSGASLPNYNSQFIMPADGYNWGILHHYNAVDVTASCGTPVKAAADGLVIPDDNFGDGTGNWNGGYGEFVLIEHPFGDQVRTRYAHLEKILVSIGDYVKQGQVIGLMGETGDATGCHVHFEVYGAQNPFAKR